MKKKSVPATSNEADIYWNLLKGLSAKVKLALIAKLSSSLISKDETKTDKHWADSFVGKWQDTRSAEEMVADIRNSRSFIHRNIEL
jgi:hypothetical protein